MSTSEIFEPESFRVTRQIRDEILDGVRLPGSKLVERDLANELGVSRLPVREALRTLVAEGLVTPRPRTWAVVREFTASDVVDLNEVQASFEHLTFTLAAQRHNREGLKRLKDALDGEFLAAEAGDAVQARRSGADFHELVTSMAGNELLNELQGILSSRIRWLMGQHDDLVRVAEEHAALYEAIADRDVDRVDVLIRQHMVTSRTQAIAKQTHVDI
ncbi:MULTISPECIES: GntR family transcriptional regulator [Arthrobacter]|uniref:GntR family transcriptional regulator n=2 Tax=Arthrobacter TaxID=1663 RepID=A0ABU9KHJ7_9MICC|nr:GntR family transcriptional regulator [Arthrobacter sp. YJM1]MDP5226241.1 GntR family transcriptional regulator [Arthrobacter sp. YJM1]